MNYWINVVSRDHVRGAVKGEFTQANHGKPYMLKRMKKGDRIIFYSPKTDFENGEPLQAFTAICQITDDEPYREVISAGFSPWRRRARFDAVNEAPIRPLISDLEFIENKTQWGYRFRFGVIKISVHDFELIRSAMR